MPNHCSNDLWIHGPKADVAAALALIGAEGDEPRFDFNSLIPYPERFAQMDKEAAAFGWDAELPEIDRVLLKARYIEKWGTAKDGFNSGGYDWRCDVWGTKWGAYDVSVWSRARGAKLRFDTAWSPPSDAIFEALLTRFPRLRLIHAYYERGAGFRGRSVWQVIDGTPTEIYHTSSNDYRGRRGG